METMRFDFPSAKFPKARGWTENIPREISVIFRGRNLAENATMSADLEMLDWNGIDYDRHSCCDSNPHYA